MFEVPKPFECLAVDEESFAHAPDLVALGRFGCGRSLDCVQLWHKDAETNNWTLGRGIKGHTSTVSCMKFMDGNNRLITGSWDRTIKIWDDVNHETKQATCVATLSGHEFEVKCIARHGSKLASGAEDKTLALWDMATGKRVLLSASPDKTIRVWDPRAGSDSVGVHITGAPMRAIALSPDGNRIFYAPFDLLQRKSCWIDARAAAGPSLDRYHSRLFARQHQNVATAEHLAILPYRLSDGQDHLLANGQLMSIPLEATGISQASIQELGYYSGELPLRCTGSKGVCWTNSQVIVTGGDKKVYMADPTTKRVVSDPLADELCKQQARSKLRALAEAQREREKQASNHLTRTPPSAREVNQDVARIQRQIEQIRRSRRPGARG
ncbi:WD domain, G-beta repeat-containing protein [Acanthamoeba castellanii str. Neff]|uniref:WD domain, G-beta repeat-containing protein n=1 Tax=Acanthamoeba castellanii (strain ATCC 30010 / Neff) TaxID=1257118 RepID=L8HEW1_ACACF|nr:WD domain, G-beta repeat-containing protein [Acanthamoeba castellanii str. Neff]ELR23308.1 WD domain, G-beta repeat-containing protein [Acanthamoeba castellanii str. Neff]